MNQPPTTDLEQQIATLGAEINAKKQEFYSLLKQLPRLKVQDYPLLTPDGEPIRLSDLFGDKDELILVHNMGKNVLIAHSDNDWEPRFSY